MIQSFVNQGTKDVYDAVRSKTASKTCPSDLWKVARRKLDQMNWAVVIEDLRAPPGTGWRSCVVIDEGSTASGSMISFGSVSSGPRVAHSTWRSWITTNEGEEMTLPKNRPPTHPGTMLLEEFLKPLGMSQTELARRIQVSFPRVNELVNEKRGVTPDTALRLSQLFGTSPEFWLNGQRNWDLWHAMRSPKLKQIRRIKPVQVG